MLTKMDIIGLFSPTTGQRRFLLVVVVYFTKWIDVKPLTKIINKQSYNLYGKTSFVNLGSPTPSSPIKGKNSLTTNLENFMTASTSSTK